MIAGSALHVTAADALNGASIVRDDAGAMDVRTPEAPWAYAVMLPIDAPATHDDAVVGVRTRVDVEVLAGDVGLFLTDADARTAIGEVVVKAGAGRATVVVNGNPAARRLCVRSGAAGGAHVKVHGIATSVRRRFDVTYIIDDVLPAMLRTPGEPALAAIASALSSHRKQSVSPQDIGALQCTRAPIAVPLERIFADPLGTVVLEETARLTALLPTYDASKMDWRSGYLGPDYFEKYFRQSTIRVCHLIEQLRELGLTRGSVLEIGSLCGQFAMPLARLGYDVTAVDRYRAFRGAYAGFVAHLRRAGVRVVEADRHDENDIIAGLGHFDAVISVAVIEHIPHSPREFLTMLASRVRPGGLLALDTPNVARYWNRRRLADGSSIHQPIEYQFYAPVPFEGHHREYTAGEMRWMLEQVGCRDVRTRMLDYNPFQYRELWADHVEALLATTVDPSLADTVLVAGQVSGDAESLSPSNA